MFHNITWKCNHGNDPWKQQKWALMAWCLLLKQKTSSYSSHQRHRKCPTLKISNTPALLILCLQVTLNFPEIIILWTAMASWCFNQKTTLDMHRNHSTHRKSMTGTTVQITRTFNWEEFFKKFQKVHKLCHSIWIAAKLYAILKVNFKLFPLVLNRNTMA